MRNSIKHIGLGLVLLGAMLSARAGGQYYPAEPAARYGEPPEVYLMDEERIALESLAETLKGYNDQPLEHDPALTLMARDLANKIQADPFRQSEILGSALMTELKDRYGIYDVPMRSRCALFRQDADVAELVKNQRPAGGGEYSRIGVGAVPENSQGQSGVIVMLLSSRMVRVDPFPRKVETGSSARLSGELINQVSAFRPWVMVTSPGGKVAKVEVKSSGPDFSAEVKFDRGSGTYRVEVVAKSDDNTKIAALFTVTASGGNGGGDGVFMVEGFETVPANEAQAESMVFEMINQVRVKAGLRELRDDWRLKEMARAHSTDMRNNNFVGHLSPQFGGLEQRKITAGLEGYDVLENVARNTQLDQAMNSLLQSPAHRVPIVSPRITHVGVAVVFKGSGSARHYYITQEFGNLD